MAEATSTTDAAVAMLASTADNTVAEAASTTDKASSTNKAVAAHHLETGGGNAGARTC